jgi:hypothetical protein
MEKQLRCGQEQLPKPLSVLQCGGSSHGVRGIDGVCQELPCIGHSVRQTGWDVGSGAVAV